MSAGLPPPSHGPQADRARALWSGGRYAAVAERLRPAAAAAAQAAGVSAGDRVLDVAAGTGNAALEAAARGAEVTASDLTPAMLVAGEARTRAAGLAIPWVEADVRDLPFADGAFDVALSVFGAMFAPEPDRVAAELARVLDPRGRLALAGWCPDGFMGALATLRRSYLPPPGGADPMLWGDEATARQRLGRAFGRVGTERRTLPWRFATVDACVRHLEEDAPPAAAARAALGERYPPLRREIAELVARSTTEPPAVVIDVPWLLVVARR